MLQEMVDKYLNLPYWMRESKRFRDLFIYDMWLDKAFYNNIPFPFNQETQPNGVYIPIHDRKPYIQHNLPHMIAYMTSRKLFGGRHTPRLKHDNDEARKRIQSLIDEIKLPSKMLEAARLGAVGSSLVTFKFVPNGAGGVKCVFDVWRSRFTTPAFDAAENLTSVCMHYTASGREMLRAGFQMDVMQRRILPRQQYWFVKCLDMQMERVFIPIPENAWNPLDGSPDLLVDAFPPQYHNLGFVPAQWLRNLPNGNFPEGECTFAAALDNFIQYDYMNSQMARGLYYSAAPQLAVKGEMVGVEVDDMGRETRLGPQNVIQLMSDTKTPDGNVIGGGDAWLVEAKADGLKVALEEAKALKRLSLEQCSVSRKDLESIKGSISGKAMEILDADYFDLILELRSQYCEFGYLPLIKKLCKAHRMFGHELVSDLGDDIIDNLRLSYPADSIPTPQEIQFLAAALAAAIEAEIMTPQDAAHYFASELDLTPDSFDQETIPSTVPGTPQDLKDATENGGADNPKATPEDGTPSSRNNDMSGQNPSMSHTDYVNVGV